MASTDIAVIEPGGFLALNHTVEEVKDIVEANLAGQEVSEFSLRRVGVPAGGATRWEIDDGLGNTESVEELSGIIVVKRNTRAYWEGEFTGGNEPPQCSSRDSVVGVGDPGGECRTCQFAQFGSAKDGKGRAQACKQMAQWFLLTEGDLLPMVVTLPPGSLKAAGDYLIALSSAVLRFDQVVTSLSLEKTKNADGIDFARVKPRLAGKLDEEAAKRAAEYGDMLRPIFDRAPVVSANGASAEAAE